MWRVETKKELRELLRGETIREVIVTGAMPDTRQIELRFGRVGSGVDITIRATPYGTLEVEA